MLKSIDKFRVEFENNNYIVNENTVVSTLINDTKKEILGIKINNENRSPFSKIICDSKCSYIKYEQKEGRRIYERTLKFIFLSAVSILFKNAKVVFTNKNGRDFFANIYGIKLTANNVKKIKDVMVEIIENDIAILKLQGNKEQIKKYYKLINSKEQIDNLERLELRKKYTINYYDDKFNELFNVNYYNYLYGNLAPSTGYIKGFDLKKYKSGIILVLPKKNNINEVEDTLQTNRVFELSDEFSQICNKTDIYNVTDLNEKALYYNITEVIRLAEYDSDIRINKIAEKIINNKDTKFVFLSGPSSSGKTTTAQKLGEFLKLLGKNSKVISMDNFFKEKGDIPIKNGKKDYDCFENLDIDLFREKILSLINGNLVKLPTYNFKKQEKEYITSPYKLDKDGILIIEGIHALNPKVYEFIDIEKIYRVYVAPIVTLGFDSYTRLSTSDLRIIRRIVRDFENRGIECESTLNQWESVKNSEEETIFPYVHLADTILNTNLIYEWGVLKSKAEFLLLRVKNDSINYAEARRLYQLLQNFVTIDEKYVPNTSILREFISNGCYFC